MHVEVLHFLDNDAATLATLARTCTAYGKARRSLQELKLKRWVEQRVSHMTQPEIVHVAFVEKQELIVLPSSTIGKPSLSLLTRGLQRGPGKPWFSFESKRYGGPWTMDTLKERLYQCMRYALHMHADQGLSLMDDKGFVFVKFI